MNNSAYTQAKAFSHSFRLLIPAKLHTSVGLSPGDRVAVYDAAHDNTFQDIPVYGTPRSGLYLYITRDMQQTMRLSHEAKLQIHLDEGRITLKPYDPTNPVIQWVSEIHPAESTFYIVIPKNISDAHGVRHGTKILVLDGITHKNHGLRGIHKNGQSGYCSMRTCIPKALIGRYNLKEDDLVGVTLVGTHSLTYYPVSNRTTTQL